jgi:iron complex outermembrane receptor protein
MLQRVLLGIFFLGWVIGFLRPDNSQAQAQTCDAVIKGVLHNHQHELMPNVSVYIKGTNQGTITNEKGYYQLNNVCLGYHTLVCQAVGYKTLEFKIQVSGNQLIHDFEMDDEAIHLQEISILGRQAPIEQSFTQSVQSIDSQELNRLSGKSLGEALKNISGVNVLQSGPTIFKPVIHGLHSNRVLILNNGIRQEGQQWGSEHAPEIDPFVATRISVVKGAAAVRYGADAIGGVVIIQPPTLPTSFGLHGEVNLVGISNGRGGVASALLEGGFKKMEGLGWRIQGTFKRLGDSESADYVLSNTGLQELNFSGAIGLKKNHFEIELFYSRFSTSLGILRSAHIGSLSDLASAIDAPRPLFIQDFTYQIQNPHQKVTHDLIKLSSNYHFDSGAKISLQYGFQHNNRKEFDIRRGGRSDLPAMNLTLFTNTLDLMYEPHRHSNWHSQVGMSGLLQSNFYDAETGIRPLVPQYQNMGLGAFWIERWIKNRWELEGGLRYEFRSLEAKRFDRKQELEVFNLQFNNLIASLGTIYNFNNYASIRTNLASAWRPPNVAELFSEGLHHGVGAIEEGMLTYGLNQNTVRFEKGYKWVNSFQYNSMSENSGKGTYLEFTAYYQYLQNYIFLEPAEVRLTIRGAFPVFHYKFTNAGLAGADLTLKHYLHQDWIFNIRGSYLAVKDRKRNNYLVFIPANRLEYGLQYERKTIPKIKSLFIGFNIIHGFRQFRTPQVISIQQIRNIESEGEAFSSNEAFDFVKAPDGYTLLNIESGIELPFSEKSLQIGLSVSNLLNTLYRDYMNRFRYYADEVGRNINLRLKYSF